jgi:hypothetical protein
MENRPTVTLKLKPYLQEFLRCKLNQDADVCAKRNFVGTIIRPFLSIRPVGEIPQLPQGDDYITIIIPVNSGIIETRRGTAYISEKNQEEVERILGAHFWDLYYQFMDDKVRYFNGDGSQKGAIKKCIMQFCSDYNISYNHINYEMMKKAYYRRRQNSEKRSNKFARKLSPSCPLLFLI